MKPESLGLGGSRGDISKSINLFHAFGHFSSLFCWHASTQACTHQKVLASKKLEMQNNF
jgi:hypothetical protein